MLKATRSCLLIATFAACFMPGATAAGAQDSQGRDSVFEQEVLDRLGRISPEAVPLFQEATEASDSSQWALAEERFLKVLDLAPGFPDAERRLSYVETGMNKPEDAVLHAERAFSADSSPYNASALARSLINLDDTTRDQEALGYAISSAGALQDDAYAQTVLLQAGLETGSEEAIRRSSEALVRILPEYAPGHFFYGISLAWDESWEQAEHELVLSRDLGMDPADVENFLAQGVRSQARIGRLKRWGLFVTGGWVVGLGLLFVFGVLLSQVTLKAVSRMQERGTYETGLFERYVRNVYRWVIAVTTGYFYISMPILFLLILAAAGGFFYLVLAVGRIPIKLTAMVAIGTLITLYGIVRSLFVRVRDEDPGRPLGREEAPALWELTDEVANSVGTRAIESIYIVPGTDIAVMERGGFLRKLRGQGRRCFILGLAALPGLKVKQLKSILAHEYGHFSNRDTAGGNLVPRTSRSMRHMAFTLVANGLAAWYNPAWWFLSGFNEIFLRVTLGASRLQEVLADRISVAAYGAKSFVAGLSHVIRRAIVFDVQLNGAYRSQGQAFFETRNLFSLPVPDSETDKETIEEKLDQAINRPSSPYDSHPPPTERFAFVEKLDSHTGGEEDSGEALDLVPNLEALQIEMTQVIIDNARQSAEAE